jgi:hypothetical protein
VNDLFQTPARKKHGVCRHLLAEFGFNLRNQGIALLIDGILRIE